MPGFRAGAGVCARRRSNFLLGRQEKVTKEKATLHAASLRFAAGNLRCSRPAGSLSNSLHCVALRQSRALIRWPLRSSAHPEGNPGNGHPHGPLLRSAQSAQRGALAPRKAERSDGPCGCSAVGCFGSPPLLAAPAAGRLRGGTRVGARVLRDLTRRGCPSGARQRKASSTAHPATAPTQVYPVAKRRGRRLGVAFSLVTFFWRPCSDRTHGKQMCGDIGNTSPWQTLPRRNPCLGNQEIS